MTLRAQLAELVSACFTGIWLLSHEHQDALTEIAQMCRDENWPSRCGTSTAAYNCPGKPAAQPDASGGDPWLPSAPSTPWPPRTARRSSCSRTFTVSSEIPRSSRHWPSRCWPASSGGPSWSSWPPSSSSPSSWRRRSPWSSTNCPVGSSLRRSPAVWPRSRGNCPRAGTGPPPGRRGRPHQDRKRERLFSRPGSSPSPGGQHHLATQGGGTEEEQPPVALPRRGDLRRPGRPGGPEELLPAGAEAQTGRQAQGPRNRPRWSAGHWEKCLHKRWAANRAGPP